MSCDEEDAERLERAIIASQRLHELTKLHVEVTGDSYEKSLASTKEYLENFDKRLAAGEIRRSDLASRLKEFGVQIRR